MKAAPSKKTSESSDDSDSDSSEDEEPKKAQATPAKKETPAKPTAVAPAKDESSSSEDSESSDSDDEEKPAVKASPAKKGDAKKAESSSSESGSDSSESSSEEDDDVEMADASAKPATNSKRKAEDDEAQPAKKAKVDAADGETKTIFVGRLSWNVDNDWLASEFAECGEVVSARVQMDRNTGKSRGFGYVTFATSEAVEKALQLSGKEIDGRPINVDKSAEKDQSTVREKRAKAFGDTPSAPSSVLFVGNLSWDATEDMIWESFSEYGSIKSVRRPTDRESGRPKGFGYVEFEDIESAKQAHEGLAGQEIAGRAIRLDFSQPRDDNGGGRGGRGGGFGGGRGRGGFDGGRGRGGFDRGRGGGRGRGGDRGRGGRGGGRGGPRTGAIQAFQGKKISFD